MNILVVTGSPRKNGNSDMFADAFIEGAQSAGNEIRRIDAGRAAIGPCLACEYCLENNGRCVQDDDMTAFYEDLEWAELIVYAIPMYFYTYPAQIKAFMDRQFCALGGRKFGLKKAAMLLVFEDKDISTADGLVQSFNIAMNYCNLEVLDIIIQNGTYEAGAIAGKPGLECAREFGASLA